MKKVDYLESLRGIAALIVVFAHFVVSFYPALYLAKPEEAHLPNGIEAFISGTPLNLLYNGKFSVAIFFVLSGFVLSYKFFRDRRAEVFLLPLIVKRYVRLLVPVLFSLVLVFAFLKYSLLLNHAVAPLTKSLMFGALWQFQPDFGAMLREAFFGVFFRSEATYNPVLWTMTFEFYGSLIVFFFVAFLRNSPHRYAAYALAAAVTVRSYYLAFILGILLSDLAASEQGMLKNQGRLKKMMRTPLLTGLLLTGLFLGSLPIDRSPEGTLYAFLPDFIRPRTWHILGAFLVMMPVLHSRRLQSILTWKPFLFLGKISFSQYIIHPLIICSLASSLMLVFARSAFYHAAFLLMFCLSLPVIIAASFLTYHLVDRRGITWSQDAYRFALRIRELLLKRAKPSIL